MENYNKVWTKFETQALAYSLLRKQLYPQYLIRGDYKLDTIRADIAIFKANYQQEPTLKLIVQVQRSDSEHTKGKVGIYTELPYYGDIPVIEIKGGEAAFNIRNIVHKLL